MCICIYVYIYVCIYIYIYIHTYIGAGVGQARAAVCGCIGLSLQICRALLTCPYRAGVMSCVLHRGPGKVLVLVGLAQLFLAKAFGLRYVGFGNADSVLLPLLESEVCL